mmetsp:Transcript_2184/g.3758  ORF Transcript_2184/g.3758 Transcript_2184/m.3758 type:complete len:267 (+) Transcript_2184:1156-1956(+)
MDHDQSDIAWTIHAIRRYQCVQVPEPLPIDGNLDWPGWETLSWTDDFVDILGAHDGIQPPRFRTRVKMAWDQSYFYVGAELEEPHVWGTITEKNATIFHDNDFEVFLDPDSDGRNYYEFEVNALGTIWELNLPKPYGEGGQPILGCNMEGLRYAIRVSGTLNDPSDTDNGWLLTLAFPWRELKQYHCQGKSPPSVGDIWKVNFSRVQWKHEVRDGKYIRIPPLGTQLGASLDPEGQEHPEDNWVWSPQGVVNMHLPDRWGEVEFVE